MSSLISYIHLCPPKISKHLQGCPLHILSDRLLQILAELWYMQDILICLERFPRCFFIFHPKLWMTIRIDGYFWVGLKPPTSYSYCGFIKDNVHIRTTFQSPGSPSTSCQSWSEWSNSCAPSCNGICSWSNGWCGSGSSMRSPRIAMSSETWLMEKWNRPGLVNIPKAMEIGP